MADKLPVSLITGALGSGKTTLLASLLGHSESGETAVLVNELGEIAIDHYLLREIDERTVLLGNGCVCCTMRGDLADELRDLLSRRERGEIPPFERVLVETTGIADPAPILYTLVSEPVVKHHFDLEAVIATVDAVNGIGLPECEKQAAVADTLILTKTDLAEEDLIAEREAHLADLNPGAQLLRVSFGEVEPSALLQHGPQDPRELAAHAGTGDHTDDLGSFVLFIDEEIDWTAFAVWLTMLLASHGPDVLRIKGLLNVGGPGPTVLDGVQHVVHPPRHLDRWPDDDRRSRLVFITRGIPKGEIERSIRTFNQAATAGASGPPST